MHLDLASFDTVKKLAAEVLARYDTVHMLVLNAGMHGTEQVTTTVDGIESAYQINHLAHFLLSRLLLPVTERFVHVSSMMHFSAVLDTESYSSTALNKLPHSARLGMSTYADTKLMKKKKKKNKNKNKKNKNKNKNATSVAIHPGYVISDIDRGSSPVKDAIMRFVRQLIARPSADGAITHVAAATHPELASMGGGLYFEDHCIINRCTSCAMCTLDNTDSDSSARGGGGDRGGVGGVAPHKLAADVEMQDWLWDTSSDIVGLDREI
jgi:NAD(P)-dependent dehydrogenase (short-subunit alcohol dehydrogenase family)